MRLGGGSEEAGWGASMCKSEENEHGHGDTGMLHAQTEGARRARYPLRDRDNELAEDSIFVIGRMDAKQQPTMMIHRTPHLPALALLNMCAATAGHGFAFEGSVRSNGPSFLLEGSLNPSSLAAVGFGDWSWTGKAGTGSVRRTFACRLKSNRSKKRDTSKQAPGSAVAFAFTSLDQQYKLWDAFSSAVADDGSVFVFGVDGRLGDSSSCKVAAPCSGDRFMEVSS